MGIPGMQSPDLAQGKNKKLNGSRNPRSCKLQEEDFLQLKDEGKNIWKSRDGLGTNDDILGLWYSQESYPYLISKKQMIVCIRCYF
jgi:hypothetical protein